MQFSRRSPKFDPKVAGDKWASFGRNGNGGAQAGAGTLFHLADKCRRAGFGEFGFDPGPRAGHKANGAGAALEADGWSQTPLPPPPSEPPDLSGTGAQPPPAGGLSVGRAG